MYFPCFFVPNNRKLLLKIVSKHNENYVSKHFQTITKQNQELFFKTFPNKTTQPSLSWWDQPSCLSAIVFAFLFLLFIDLVGTWENSWFEA